MPKRPDTFESLIFKLIKFPNMSGLYSAMEKKFSIVATGSPQPVFIFHSAGQEEWEVTTASIYSEERFVKVKHFEG